MSFSVKCRQAEAKTDKITQANDAQLAIPAATGNCRECRSPVFEKGPKGAFGGHVPPLTADPVADLFVTLHLQNVARNFIPKHCAYSLANPVSLRLTLLSRGP